MSTPSLEKQCLDYLKDEAGLDPALVEYRIESPESKSPDVIVTPKKWIEEGVWAELTDYAEAMNGGWHPGKPGFWTFDLQSFKDRLEDKADMAYLEWWSQQPEEKREAMKPPGWAGATREEKYKMLREIRAKWEALK